MYKQILTDPATSRSSRIILLCALGYLAMPFDLIPDFLPVVGHLDDVVIVPAMIHWALRELPPEMRKKYRQQIG